MQAAAKSIHHRGPDQSGTFESDTVSLGVVRLKIIDLTGGEQPMHSDDRNSVIVFNGEVYNHAEIRRDRLTIGSRWVPVSLPIKLVPEIQRRPVS